MTGCTILPQKFLVKMKVLGNTCHVILPPPTAATQLIQNKKIKANLGNTSPLGCIDIQSCFVLQSAAIGKVHPVLWRHSGGQKSMNTNVKPKNESKTAGDSLSKPR